MTVRDKYNILLGESLLSEQQKGEKKMNLSETGLFRGMEEKEIERLLQCLSAAGKRYRKGEVVLREGEPAEQIGIVLSGMVLLENDDVWGNHSVLGSAAPGAVFAEAYACIPGEPLLISAAAAEETDVLFLDVGKVLSVCTNACPFHEKLVRNLLEVCARKSLELSRRILHTGPKSIRGRLLSYFSECAKKAGGSDFVIPYNRQQLADYLGVDRSAMCSELSRMRRDGLIEYGKNRFRLMG